MARKEGLALGVGSAQIPDVCGQNGAREGGHPSDHQGHEFRTGHAGDVGFDEQGSLGLAHEDVGRGSKGFCTRELEAALHDPGKSSYDALQDSEMKEQRGDGAKEDDGREHLKGKEVAKGVDASHQVAKEKEAAFAGETQQGHKATPDGVK